MGAANKFKDLFTKQTEGPTNKPQRGASHQEKARIEQLRKALQDKIKNDPKLAKKAAMIVEEMLKQKKK